MTDEQKEWIDNASYEVLLRKWRFAPSGDPIFQGDTGQYYSSIMFGEGRRIGPAAVVAASKSVGWEG